MDLIIHVTEANNLHCESWKESLDQTSLNYSQAIRNHRESLQSLSKEIRTLAGIKSSMRMVASQSRVVHANYIRRIRQLEEEQSQASAFFSHSEQQIDDISVLAQHELQNIDKSSVELSLAMLEEAKLAEEEAKQQLLRLSLLKAKADYLAQKIGLSVLEKDANTNIAKMGEKILKHKDAKEKAEALKYYKERLELTLASLKKQRDLLPDQCFSQESPKVNASAIAELQNKAEGYQNLLQKSAERLNWAAANCAAVIDVVNQIQAMTGMPGHKLTISNCFFQGNKFARFLKMHLDSVRSALGAAAVQDLLAGRKSADEIVRQKATGSRKPPDFIQASLRELELGLAESSPREHESSNCVSPLLKSKRMSVSRQSVRMVKAFGLKIIKPKAQFHELYKQDLN